MENLYMNRNIKTQFISPLLAEAGDFLLAIMLKQKRPIPEPLLILSRFELLTFRLGGGRSIQLSYRIIKFINCVAGYLFSRI